MRNNVFLHSVYIDRNVLIFHHKGNRCNFCKCVYFLTYILHILIVLGTCYLTSYLVYFFSSFFIWGTMRNIVSYVTRMFYRLSCLVSSCPYFSPLVVNHLLCEIVMELFRVPFMSPITILTKIIGINVIHYKD